MQPGKIERATRALGAPIDWDTNTSGECDVLPIRDEIQQGVRVMHSVWLPTDEEKQAIAAGRPVVLTVWGSNHPPVSINVPSA